MRLTKHLNFIFLLLKPFVGNQKTSTHRSRLSIKEKVTENIGACAIDRIVRENWVRVRNPNNGEFLKRLITNLRVKTEHPVQEHEFYINDIT